MAGWISLGALLVIALVLEGCGGSVSATQRQARCFDAHRDDAADSPIPVSDSAWQDALRRICREAEREGKLSSAGGFSKAELEDMLSRHPQVDYPICTETLIRVRDEQMTPLQAKHFPTQMMRRLARHYCDVVFGSGLATDGDGFTEADKDAISRSHPELLTPFCVASAEPVYDAQHHLILTQADFRKVMNLVCTKSARRGYMRMSGKIDDAAVKSVLRRVMIRLIRQGRIHPLR